MKMTITTAETDNTEFGKISVKQSYSLDATEDFENYTEGMGDDEIIETAYDLDFFHLSETEITTKLHNAVRGWSTVDVSIENVSISFSGPGGWSLQTVEEARNKVKNITIEVEAEFSYEMDYTFKENLEKAVLAAVSSEGNKLKKIEES